MTSQEEPTNPMRPAPKKPTTWDYFVDGVVRNWRTTLCGVASAAAFFIAANPGLPVHPLVISAAKFAAGGGLVFLGICAKDSGNTGAPGNPR